MRITKTLLVTCLFSSTSMTVSSEEVTNWLDIFDGYNDSILSNTNTASPTLTNATKTSIAAKFSEVTLADGESITLSGSMTVNEAIANGSFRIGLFDAPDPLSSSGGDNYVGVYSQAGLTSAGADIKSRAAITGIDHPFDSTGATTLGGANVSGSYAKNTPVSFFLTLTRNGSGLEISSSYTQSGGYSVTGTESYTPASFTYDTAAFLHAASFSNQTASYSGIQIVSAADPSPPLDSDSDGMPDAYEMSHGLDPAVNDAASSLDSDTLTNLQEYQGADGTPGTGDETLPENSDTDGDGDPDDLEVANTTDPNDPLSKTGARLFGIDFNRNDALNSPSQSRFRTISGSTVQSNNTASYTKTIGSAVITVSQPTGEALEFRGAYTDSTREIPGGNTSLSFLVADFVATKKGAIRLEITNQPAGDYFFRSWHIEPHTQPTLGYAQGATTITPNTIEARVDGILKDSVVTTALGSSGLNTTLIDDRQIPSLGFSISHGGGPLVIDLTSTLSNEVNTFLLLNGFEIYQSAP